MRGRVSACYDYRPDTGSIFSKVRKIGRAAVETRPSLTAPLSEAGISVVAISTFNTDYLLVKEKDLERAVKALRGQGYNVR